MNQKLKQLILHALLVINLLTISTNIMPVKAASIATEKDETEIRDVVNQYFALRYQELETLTPADYSQLVDRQDATTSVWRKTEKDRFDILYRAATTFKDFVVASEFWLDDVTIKFSGKKATVFLIETNKIVYSSNLKSPSRMGALQHELTLVNGQQGWIIQNDQYVDDLTFVMSALTMSQIFQNIQTNYESISRNEKGNSSVSNAPQTLDESLALYRYSNFAAAHYSSYYYNSAGNIPENLPNSAGWNASWPMTYKVYSSDCANFVSQAIFKGISYTNSDGNAIYPDSSHYSDWWYYKFSSPVDGSSAWINVEALYNYLLRSDVENAGRGPIGESVEICNAGLKAGNPILMKLGDSWAHAGIIASKTSDCNITVNAHSTNYFHKPISYYSVYTWYPVNINGYYK